MISILLSTPCIAPGRLQMTVRIHADPDILVGRRDRQTGDSLQFFARFDRPPIGKTIAKTFACADTLISRNRIRYVDQARSFCHVRRLIGSCDKHFGGHRSLNSRGTHDQMSKSVQIIGISTHLIAVLRVHGRHHQAVSRSGTVDFITLRSSFRPRRILPIATELREFPDPARLSQDAKDVRACLSRPRIQGSPRFRECVCSARRLTR